MNLSHVARPKAVLCENGQLTRIAQSAVGRQITHAKEGGLPGRDTEIESMASLGNRQSKGRDTGVQLESW